MISKQVIVVRTDLNMRKGKLAAQVAHASMGVILKYIKNNEIALYNGRWIPHGDGYSRDLGGMLDWLNGSFTKIVVGIPYEQELLQLSRDADSLYLPSALIKDEGRTEFGGIPTYTALAIGPDWSDRVDVLTSHLKLL